MVWEHLSDDENKLLIDFTKHDFKQNYLINFVKTEF